MVVGRWNVCFRKVPYLTLPRQVRKVGSHVVAEEYLTVPTLGTRPHGNRENAESRKSVFIHALSPLATIPSLLLILVKS